MTPIRSISSALKNDYSQNTKQRSLQLGAKAHITVQQWVDKGGLKDHAASVAGLREIHRRFCTLLPEDLLWVENPVIGERMEIFPGELRQRDVKVGRRIPISPGALPRFMRCFEEAYCGPGKTESIFAAAAAHHRLQWLHPFLDGNGRVARRVLANYYAALPLRCPTKTKSASLTSVNSSGNHIAVAYTSFL